MSDQEIKTLEGLRVLIIERYDGLGKDIGEVKSQLKELDDEIRAIGNGKTGIGVRLANLENAQKAAKENKENKKNWIGWIIVLAAAVATVLSSVLGPLIAYLITRWLPL